MHHTFVPLAKERNEIRFWFSEMKSGFGFQNLQTTLPTVRMIVDVSKSALVLSSQQVIKLLKSKEASNVVDIKVRAWAVRFLSKNSASHQLCRLYYYCEISQYNNANKSHKVLKAIILRIL